ncbi:helix-turn-helix domain-containing protein [Actinoplanes sp. ATCC 53533]|uniref:helix-turn-helix domain-containing protein n=1 Tax=Actinoplanes sp. ATCC 53533 TaxID=1288362 RepID=UPI0018F68C9F|nr:helix-turn-helix domain-containing protein [Actinoplanes sp. ATCC 53533]
MTELDAQPTRGTDSRGTLGTVRNAALLLHLLSDGPAHQQLTELAERSGLSLPTVHRLLRSLTVAGLVEQDARSARYGLGPELVRLSQRYLGRLPVLAALSPYLLPVRDALGTSVRIVLFVRGSVTYIDGADGADAGPYREPHRVVPAVRSAAGRLLAARADDTGWALALALASADERADAETRRAAWRTASHLTLAGAEQGHTEVAVPVVDAYDHAAAALTATVGDNDVDRAATHLDRAAQAAGRTLGHA